MFTQIRSAFSLLSLPFLPPPLLSQNYGKTALHFAASGGNPRIVEILIKADPSGDHLNKKGNSLTALARAIQQDGYGIAGAAECAALLRAAGAV